MSDTPTTSKTKKTPKQVPDTFLVIDVEGKYKLQHKESGTILETLHIKNKDTAEEVAYAVNDLSQFNRGTWNRRINNEKTPDSLKKVMQEALKIVHPEKERAAATFLPKEKSANSYTSAARNAFTIGGPITSKEQIILRGVRDAKIKGVTPTCENIANIVGMGVNVVSGSVSVLLMKKYVRTEKVKDGGTKAVRCVFLLDGVDPEKIEVKGSNPNKTPKAKREGADKNGQKGDDRV